MASTYNNSADKADALHLEEFAAGKGGKFDGIEEHIQEEVRAHVRVAAEEELTLNANPWATFRKNPKALAVLLVIMSTSIVNGIELSMSGSMLGSQAFCKVMGAYDATSDTYVVAAAHVSAFTAAAVPTFFAGIFIASIIGDRFGRRVVVQVCMCVIIIGAIIETFSRNWQEWAVSKAVMGIATGAIQAGCATYIAEIAPREIRGMALISYQLFTNIGNLLSAVTLDLSVDHWTDPANTLQYKLPLYIMIALPVVIMIGVFTILEESPAWLVLKGRLPQAMKSLKGIYPYMSVDELELELAKLQYTVEKEAEEASFNKASAWLDCFRGTNLRRTIVAMIPQLSYVMGGNVLFLLTAYFFALAGQSNALQSTVIVNCCGIAFNVIAICLVENKRVGRYTIYMVGLFVLGLGMMMVGAVGKHWADPGASTTGSNLLIAGVVIGYMGMQLGPQAVSSLYASETGSSHLRAKTTSLGQSLGALMGQLSGVYFPFMLTAWNAQCGFFFGGMAFFFFVIAYFVVPDYTGRSHAQIDELYVRKIPARKFASTECTGNYGRELFVEA